MEIIKVNSEMLIGSIDNGYTHLCFDYEYTEPYKITIEKAENAKNAGVITEEEYKTLTTLEVK